MHIFQRWILWIFYVELRKNDKSIACNSQDGKVLNWKLNELKIDFQRQISHTEVKFVPSCASMGWNVFFHHCTMMVW